MITLYHPVSVSAHRYHPGMPGDHANMAVSAEPAPGSAPVPAVAGELLARVRAELPAVAGLGPREELLAAAWRLTSLRSPRTRRACAGDLRGWLAWLEERGVDVLATGRVHVDLWVAGQTGQGAEASVRRRLSALSSFYRYCAAHDLVARIPTAGVARPAADPDHTATIGLDRALARALVAAADADRGPRALRSAAIIRLSTAEVRAWARATGITVPGWASYAPRSGTPGGPRTRAERPGAPAQQ